MFFVFLFVEKEVPLLTLQNISSSIWDIAVELINI